MQVEDRRKVNNLLEAYGWLLTEKQRTILKEYYELDLSLFEIAEQYNITRQAVRDTVVRATKQLYDYESKLEFVSKREKISKILEKSMYCECCKEDMARLKSILED